MELNIIYYGDGPWAHLALKKLISDGFNILLVVVRNDHKDPELIKIANENNIQYTWHKNVNSDEFIDKLKGLKPNLGVSMSFNQIFKESTLSFFPQGIINCHAGKLPNYRGRNILNWALINDEQEVGVTCHYVDKGIDTGDIILQKTFPITDSDDYSTLLDKAIKLCPEVLVESVHSIKNNAVNRIQQPQIGSYFIQRKNGDEIINWNWTSRRVFNFVRAITIPGPCAQSSIMFKGNKIAIKIIECNYISNATSYICINGGVIGFSSNNNPLIKTEDSFIEITNYVIDDETKTKLRVGDRLISE